MKLKSLFVAILAVAFFAGCDSADKMPPAIKTVADAKALLIGKTWHVADVGLKAPSFSEVDQNEPLSVEWLSAAQSLGEYESKAKEDFGKASLSLSRDTVVHTTNLSLSGDQTYVITDEEKEDTQPGVRLELTGGSDDFKDMGITVATYTYFVLAANEEHLVLQAPNEINNRKVVLLLRAN